MMTLRPSLSGDYTVRVRITTPTAPSTSARSSSTSPAPACASRCARTRRRPPTSICTCTSPAPRRSGRRCRRAHHQRRRLPLPQLLGSSFTCRSPTGATPTARWPSAPAAPRGTSWTTLGYCRNPRLDIDSIDDNGIPENINVDVPQTAGTYRVMVHYWAGTRRRAPAGQRLLRRPPARHLRGGARRRPQLRLVGLDRRRRVARRRRDAGRGRRRHHRLHAHAAAPAVADHRLLGHQHLDVLSHAAGGRAPGPQGRRAARLTAAASSPRSRGRGWR
jgi:hypothetical protein